MLFNLSTSRNSTTSSLTSATALHRRSNKDNQKRPAEDLPSSSEEYDSSSPSPVKKKALANSDCRRSDDYSILSGNDSDRWECEDERVVHFFAKQAELEEQLDNAAMYSGPPIAEVY